MSCMESVPYTMYIARGSRGLSAVQFELRMAKL